MTNYSVTIPDGSGIGTFIFGLSAEDIVFGLERRYYIGGYDADKFQINQETGVVTTARTLRSVGGSSSFQLEIQGTDSFVKDPSSSIITIHVDLSHSIGFPRATAEPTSFTFTENTRNISMVQVQSEPGVNFEIGGGNVGNAFEVDSLKGEVRISGIGLDYELAKTYELWILVRNESWPKLMTALRLTIIVMDENDNEPMFEKSSYEMSILEENVGATKIGRVRATDADSGVFGEVHYRFSQETQTSIGHLFTIDSNSGEISAESKLDREEVASYSLTVEATDLGNPVRSGSTSVHITLEDKNDNPPRFTRLFTVNVTENVPLGTFVIQVTSVDKDIGRNGNCSYIFTENSGIMENPFQIEPISGNVTVVGALDRETQDEYLIRIAAIDGSWRAETLLTITIQDLNDNAPQFEQSFYSFNVAEGKEHVAYVGQVMASDRDKRGPNSVVNYALRHPSDLFSVDPISGEIFTKQTLHYKRMRRKESPENEHSVVITAKDRGKPPLSSDTSVSINVVDSKNSAPVFQEALYEFTVLETTKVGDHVGRIVALEPEDVGFNAAVQYSFLSGNGTRFFDIDPNSGWIRLLADLNGRRGQSFETSIAAMDKGIPPLSAQAKLHLFVSGPNDHAPVFNSLSYSVIVPENELVGTVIVTLSGRDEDPGPNGQITYNITGGNEAGKFEIEPLSGALSIREALDYETKKEFQLNVTATDRGFIPLHSEVQVKIILTDINDNAPAFPQSNYVAQILENSEIGTLVLQISAVDFDSPKFALIHYALVGGSGMNVFAINKTTGEIVSRAIFDYEDRRDYELEVMASNPGSSLFNTTRILVQIVGVNEYFPRFVQPVFQFVVSESAPLGTFVGVVEGTDEDGGPDGVINYFFLGSSADRGFRVNSKTGEITIARRLDRESQSRVVLSILAKNEGPIRGNDIDEAQIIIVIQDGNDPPVFKHELYAVDVSESIPPGSELVTVEAHDVDVRPSNNQFSYEILEGDENGTFKIDPVSGIIETVEVLDRETQPFYTLLIGAADFGEPPQTGLTTVRITLLDENDNGPVLDRLSRNGSILENEPIGTKIMTLRAVDPDLAPNNGPFTFTLASEQNNGKEKAKVEPNSGLVTSLVSFDRETTPEFTISIEISDNGVPVRKTVERVKIQVVDVNDNPSEPRNVELVLLTLKQRIPKGFLAELTPVDPDLVGNYTCRFEGRPRNSDFSFSSGCCLIMNRIPGARKQTFKVISGDGRHAEVTSAATIHYSSYESETLDESLILRIGGRITPERVLKNGYMKFMSLFRRIFESDPQILGLLPHSNGTDLVLGMKYTDRNAIVDRLVNHAEAIEQIAEAPIQINYSPCNGAQIVCQHESKGCSFSIKAQESNAVTQTRHLILSVPKLEVEVSCTCGKEYEGPHCEFRKDPCNPNPCGGGGICGKSEHDYECTCPPGRKGKHCELKARNACESNPCRNGGSCHQEHTLNAAYFCLCRPGFFGRTCAVAASDPCTPNPCQNGAECVTELTAPSHPKCLCKNQFYGKYCEQNSLGFSQASFMSFPPLDPNLNDISLVFSTNMKNSLLVYNYGEQVGGRSDFLVLELVEGHTRFAFGGSRTAVGSVTLPQFVADGKWHKILAIRNTRSISLTISDCEENGSFCKDCPFGDSTCYVTDIGHTG